MLNAATGASRAEVVAVFLTNILLIFQELKLNLAMKGLTFAV